MKRRELLTLAAGGLALPLSSAVAEAGLVRKFAEDLSNNEYNWFPERSLSGPLLIIVSIPDQKVHVYRNGIRVAASTCSTGKPGHATPTGVFRILEKDKFHRSSTYNNAPMPNMNRLTWSGIALHAGNLPGYPASHGCVRLPMGFSELLFGITKKGMTVVIADNSTEPSSVVHPSLVLGSYPREKFNAVASRMASENPIEEERAAHASLIISGKKHTATLYEDNKLVAHENIYITEPERPLGSRVYHLDNVDTGKGVMKWQSVSSGKGDLETTGNEFYRIKTKPSFAEEVHTRTRRGLTIVTTPDAHLAENRSKRGFVVFDSLY